MNYSTEHGNKAPGKQGKTPQGQGAPVTFFGPSQGAWNQYLGTTAKSSPPPPPEGVKATRTLRYQAQSQARSWLIAEAKANHPDKYPGDVFRTADCRYVNHSDVAIQYSSAYRAAHYSGLVTCGSVWACPVCAARIQERRRLEIEEAIQWAKDNDLVCVLVTFTFPHRAWHKLKDLISQQREAFKLLRKGKAWDLLKASGGFIRSLEVTHGQNGWHPHTHELWFCDRSNLPDVRRLVKLWESACIRVGLLDESDLDNRAAFAVHSVDVKLDMTAGDYLAKQDDSRAWGFSHEVSKATSKAGRGKGVHPHHFLVRQAPGDADSYLEYVQAMKGSRQLFWSPGLKDRVGVDEVSDEIIADESREVADLLAILSPEQWKVIRGNDARAEILDAAELGGVDAVYLLLASLGCVINNFDYVETVIRASTPEP